MSGADGVPNPVLHVSGNPESAPRPDAVPSESPMSAVAMPTGLPPQAHVRQPSRAAANSGPSQPLPSDAFLLPVAVASSSSPDGQPQPGRGHVRAPSKQAAPDHGGGRRSIRTHARAPSRYVMDADQQVHPTATFQLPSGVQDDEEPSGGRPRKDPQDLARKDRALPSAKQAALEQHMARSADSQLVVASPVPESRHSSGTGSNGASVKAGPAEPRSMKGGEARHRNGSPVSPGGDHRLQERRQFARSSPVGVKPRLFVSLMIVTDVALCVYSMYLNGWQFESFSTNPLLGPSSSVLDGMGAKDTGRIRAGEWWRLVTAMCLHSYGLASAPESLAPSPDHVLAAGSSTWPSTCRCCGGSAAPSSRGSGSGASPSSTCLRASAATSSAPCSCRCRSRSGHPAPCSGCWAPSTVSRRCAHVAVPR